MAEAAVIAVLPPLLQLSVKTFNSIIQLARDGETFKDECGAIQENFQNLKPIIERIQTNVLEQKVGLDLQLAETNVKALNTSLESLEKALREKDEKFGPTQAPGAGLTWNLIFFGRKFKNRLTKALDDVYRRLTDVTGLLQAGDHSELAVQRKELLQCIERLNGWDDLINDLESQVKNVIFLPDALDAHVKRIDRLEEVLHLEPDQIRSTYELLINKEGLVEFQSEDVHEMREIHKGHNAVVKLFRMQTDKFGLKTGDLVAVKLFQALGDTAQRQKAFQDFQHEAKIIHYHTLHCSNVCKLIGVIKRQNGWGIVMDYYKKGNLSSKIPETGMLVGSLYSYCEGITMAVRELFNSGIKSLQDLKPENILIDDNDQPIVTDFGLVHLSKEVAAKCNVTVTDPSVGRPIARRGTVRYMAPEVFLHKPDVVASEKTDVWSFGCMLLKMATGENPYLAELDEDRIARLMRVRRAPHAGSARAKELPQELQEILNSCLSFDPATRPTFAELNDRFQLLKIGVPLSKEKDSQRSPQPPAVRISTVTPNRSNPTQTVTINNITVEPDPALSVAVPDARTDQVTPPKQQTSMIREYSEPGLFDCTADPCLSCYVLFCSCPAYADIRYRAFPLSRPHGRCAVLCAPWITCLPCPLVSSRRRLRDVLQIENAPSLCVDYLTVMFCCWCAIGQDHLLIRTAERTPFGKDLLAAAGQPSAGARADKEASIF